MYEGVCICFEYTIFLMSTGIMLDIFKIKLITSRYKSESMVRIL